MKDPFGREIKNIRISLTQRCDLNCFYCHREGELKGSDGTLSPSDVNSILKTASQLDITKVKFSGGEPLMHPEIVRIIEIADNHMEDVSMTTNGILLGDICSELKDAGLDRVNVSLDTLNGDIYRDITGRDKVKEAMRGIERAVGVGLYPVKINTLLMKGVNDDEIEELIEFSGDVGAILQLIEMTTSVDGIDEDFYREYHMPLDKIAERLRKRAHKIVKRDMHARKKYFLTDPKVEVELVRTMHNSTFCENCTRLRVTSNAELKPCLLRTDNHVNIRKELDEDEPLKDKFMKAIGNREPYWR
ncbi:MAG: GTP 3',8-cyclase MoaA [Candidatus Saliniplasma sp.]